MGYGWAARQSLQPTASQRRTLDQLRGQGRRIDEDLLAHISPAHNQNIGLFSTITVDIEAERAQLAPPATATTRQSPVMAAPGERGPRVPGAATTPGARRGCGSGRYTGVEATRRAPDTPSSRRSRRLFLDPARPRLHITPPPRVVSATCDHRGLNWHHRVAGGPGWTGGFDAFVALFVRQH